MSATRPTRRVSSSTARLVDRIAGDRAELQGRLLGAFGWRRRDIRPPFVPDPSRGLSPEGVSRG